MANDRNAYGRSDGDGSKYSNGLMPDNHRSLPRRRSFLSRPTTPSPTEKNRPTSPDQHRSPKKRFWNGLWSVPVLISSETLFEVGALAAGFAPVPGLAPCVAALAVIYKSVEEVSYNKERCKSLSQKANNVIVVIQDNWTSGESDKSKLQRAIDKTLATLEAMKADLHEWAQHSFWKSWYNRHDMDEKLNDHEDGLKECTALIQLASVLAIHAEVKKLQATIQAAQKAQTPISTKEMHSAQEKLLKLRTTPDEQSVLMLPAELVGECVKVGATPATSGSNFDIWKGLWLGKIPVALKLCRDFRVGVRDDKAMERFNRQIEIWRRLNYKHVLALHGWTKLDGDDDIYLVSPWLDNGNIKHYLSNNKVSPADSVRLITEILRGIQYLHKNKVLHGSVQPSNILVEEHGQAVVSDFTLSKTMAPDAMNTRSNTQTSALRYQAPEISENKPMTAEGDIYSWAMTSLEVVSGSAPYHTSRTPGQMMKAIIADKKSPEAIHHHCTTFLAYPALWEILASCWQRESAERPSVGTVLQQLENLKSQEVEA